MMHDREKSNSAIVATKPTNKAGATAAEVVLIARLRRDGAKGGDQEERERAKHAPEPDARVTGARSRTASRGFAVRLEVRTVCLNWASTGPCGGR